MLINFFNKKSTNIFNNIQIVSFSTNDVYFQNKTKKKIVNFFCQAQKQIQVGNFNTYKNIESTIFNNYYVSKNNSIKLIDNNLFSIYYNYFPKNKLISTNYINFYSKNDIIIDYNNFYFYQQISFFPYNKFIKNNNYINFYSKTFKFYQIYINDSFNFYSKRINFQKNYFSYIIKNIHFHKKEFIYFYKNSFVFNKFIKKDKINVNKNIIHYRSFKYRRIYFNIFIKNKKAKSNNKSIRSLNTIKKNNISIKFNFWINNKQFNNYFYNNKINIKKIKVNSNKSIKSKKINKLTKSKYFIIKKNNPNNIKEYSNYEGLSQIKSLFYLINGSHCNISMINAISFARFAFDWENYQFFIQFNNKNKVDFINYKKFSTKNQKNSKNFLNTFQLFRNRKFRFVAIYIQNLVRITFTSIYLKKAQFLITFFAYVFSKLPRNRKQTTFIRFLIKIIKIVICHRKEILGFRFRFQGRVNRWNRTKYIDGSLGLVPFYTYGIYMDYGMAQAITRKGSQGLRLWIAYKSIFSVVISKTFFEYISYNKSITN